MCMQSGRVGDCIYVRWGIEGGYVGGGSGAAAAGAAAGAVLPSLSLSLEQAWRGTCTAHRHGYITATGCQLH